MKSNNRFTLIFIGLLFLMTTACGSGGGGGNAPNNSITSANAGTAQNVSVGALVTLDGSQSTGADGKLLTYSWTFTTKPAGSSSSLSSATIVNPSFTPDLPGAYTLSLVVNDGTVSSAPSTVTITASIGNSAPVANAGPDKNVVTGSLVTLNGSGSSDANGDTLTYSWSLTSKPAGSTATLSSATVVNPTFTADIAGAYVLSLIVNDGTVSSAADTVTITAATLANLTLTLNPVLDFYINRTWYTDTNTLWGYGVDTLGTSADGVTGSAYGTSGGRPYHNFFKLLYNFNISSLSGATIQSAYFRSYLYGKTGTDTPRNAILENIFYGNMDSIPASPRNYDNEFGGYTVSPAISGSAAATAVGWIQFDVTAKLQADIDAGRTNSQFRLSHEDASNWGLYYYCNWYMANNASNKPELVVTYNQ